MANSYLTKENIIKKINLAIDALSERLIEREQLTRLVILTIFSKSHMFLIGERGVAKSLAIRLIGDLIEKSKYWELQVGIDTEPKQLFGEKRISENGTVFYEAKNTVLDSNIVFLDEMFKAKSEVLNMLLQVMVDRYYTTGDGRMINVPLISLFGASNEYPTGELAEPYLDRLLFWVKVERIQSFENRKNYFSFNFNRDKIEKTLFTIEEIEYVFKKAKKIAIPQNIIDTFINIVQKMIKQGVKTSDRKYLNSLEAMKVCAYLNNRNTIDYSDLFLLLFTAWHNDIEERKVQDVLYYEIFSSTANFEGEIKKIKNGIEVADNFLNGNMYNFINYNMSFTSENASIKYNNFLDSTKHILNKYYEQYEKNEKLIGRVKFIFKVDEMIANNIFIIDVKNNALTEKILKDIDDIKATVSRKIKDLSKWIDSNETLVYYKKNCTLLN